MPGLIAAPRTFTAACSSQPGLLALFDQGEQAAQALVLDHSRLGDAPNLVEGLVALDARYDITEWRLHENCA